MADQQINMYWDTSIDEVYSPNGEINLFCLLHDDVSYLTVNIRDTLYDGIKIVEGILQ